MILMCSNMGNSNVWIFANVFVNCETSVSSLHFKLKSCTPWSILLKMTFPGDFSSDIESISTILSAAWYTIDWSTPIYYFLADFLGIMRVLNSDGFDSEPLWIVGTRCKCRSAGVDFFSTSYHFFFKLIETYD